MSQQIAHLKAQAESMASKAMVFPQEPNFSAAANNDNRRPSFSGSNASRNSKGSIHSQRENGWKPTSANSNTVAKKVAKERQQKQFNTRDHASKMMHQANVNAQSEARKAQKSGSKAVRDHNIANTQYHKQGGQSEGAVAQQYINQARKVNRALEYEMDAKLNWKSHQQKMNNDKSGNKAPAPQKNTGGTFGTEPRFSQNIGCLSPGRHEREDTPEYQFRSCGTDTYDGIAPQVSSVPYGEEYHRDGGQWPPQTSNDAKDEELLNGLAEENEYLAQRSAYNRPELPKRQSNDSCVNLGEAKMDYTTTKDQSEHTVVLSKAIEQEIREQAEKNIAAEMAKKYPNQVHQQPVGFMQAHPQHRVKRPMKLSALQMGGDYMWHKWPPQTEYKMNCKKVKEAGPQPTTLDGPFDEYGQRKYFANQTNAAGACSKQLHSSGQNFMGRINYIRPPEPLDNFSFDDFEKQKTGPYKAAAQQGQQKDRTIHDLLAQADHALQHPSDTAGLKAADSKIQNGVNVLDEMITKANNKAGDEYRNIAANPTANDVFANLAAAEANDAPPNASEQQQLDILGDLAAADQSPGIEGVSEITQASKQYVANIFGNAAESISASSSFTKNAAPKQPERKPSWDDHSKF